LPGDAFATLTRATEWVGQTGRAFVKPFRLGIVGAGRMGSTHARAVTGCPGIEIGAVVEPSDVAMARLGAVGRRYRDVGELLAGQRPDGALVAVPTRLHEEVVSSLLREGVPVLCEKPLGLTAASAARLGDLAAAGRVPLVVGYWRRFLPELRALRAQIAAGEFGEVQFVLCAQWDESPPPAAFRQPASSGGILVDMGVHEIDQIRWLLGQDIDAAAGFAATVRVDAPVPGDPESVSIAARLSGGATALITLIRRHPPGEIVRLEVVGTARAVRLEPIAPPNGADRLLRALRAQLEDFVSAARGSAAEGATAADAVAALRTVEGISKALQ
jgi:myo-inositol 2-dehydrogenase/D-chiro-inositol 1-dehydrogenase